MPCHRQISGKDYLVFIEAQYPSRIKFYLLISLVYTASVHPNLYLNKFRQKHHVMFNHGYTVSRTLALNYKKGKETEVGNGEYYCREHSVGRFIENKLLSILWLLYRFPLKYKNSKRIYEMLMDIVLFTCESFSVTGKRRADSKKSISLIDN